MYSIVLATVLTAGAATSDCNICYGPAYPPCYGGWGYCYSPVYYYGYSPYCVPGVQYVPSYVVPVAPGYVYPGPSNRNELLPGYGRDYGRGGGRDTDPSGGGSGKGKDKDPSGGGSGKGKDKDPSGGGTGKGKDEDPSGGGSGKGKDKDPSGGGSGKGKDKDPDGGGGGKGKGKDPDGGGGSARQIAPATVVVKAPREARVTADGVLVSRSSEKDTFLTPDLHPGRSYFYLFRVEVVQDGKTVTRTQEVLVQAGQRSEVDFSELGEGSGTARVTVLLPRGSTLFVNGAALTSTSTRTVYETPRLQAGRVYHYTMEVRGEGQDSTVSRTKRRVQVEAGKDVTVDFAALSAAQTVQR
jgi:uncharacterized protein (TIGR03000 family)